MTYVLDLIILSYENLDFQMIQTKLFDENTLL